ncbi:MAG: o-succinylbenzoate synthase [Actinomycetota bacterium]
MNLEAVELRRVAIPLVAPFRTSFGTEIVKDALLVRAIGADAEGWGECVAMTEPLYSSEYVDAAEHVVRHQLLPRLLAHDDVAAADVASVLEPVKGHRMAKAAIETAVLDAELRCAGVSMATHLGGTQSTVASGVSVGIMNSVGELLDTVQRYLDEGYVRVKLKIEPGWDFEPVRAVRERFGDDLLLQVDANTAYALTDAPHLKQLDAFKLLLIEQPLPEDDVLGHADLATLIETPVCLDESIESLRDAATAIRLGAAAIINVKAGRVGGYLEAKAIHDLCLAHRVPVWCGGMLETGIGRAANVALASLPGFTLPGDTSASDRYFKRDITAPFVLVDGHIAVPNGPGIGVDPVMDFLDEVTTAKEVVRATR